MSIHFLKLEVNLYGYQVQVFVMSNEAIRHFDLHCVISTGTK